MTPTRTPLPTSATRRSTPTALGPQRPGSVPQRRSSSLLRRTLRGLPLLAALGLFASGCASERAASAPARPAAPTAVQDRPAAPLDVSQYEGTYTLRAGTATLDARIYQEGGRLMAQAEGQGVSALLPQGDHAFVFEVNRDIRLVFSGEPGRSESVTLYQNGREFPGRRKP